MKLSLPVRIGAVLLVIIVGVLLFRMNQPSTVSASNAEMELQAPDFATDARVNAEAAESMLGYFKK